MDPRITFTQRVEPCESGDPVLLGTAPCSGSSHDVAGLTVVDHFLSPAVLRLRIPNPNMTVGLVARTQNGYNKKFRTS